MSTRTSITWEDFLAAGEEWQEWEWVDGEVVYMTPVNIRHEAIVARLVAYLVDYCRSHPGWACLTSNAVFTMASGNWRCPDASLVRLECFPGRTLPEKKSDIAPDCAFEILSPSASASASEIQRKRQDYKESGVIQVGIDPEKRLTELIYPDRPLQYFQPEQLLVIDTLPGFSLELKTLFAI